MTVTVERIRHSGALVVSAIVGRYLERRTYYGYSKREAIRDFKSQFK